MWDERFRRAGSTASRSKMAALSIAVPVLLLGTRNAKQLQCSRRRRGNRGHHGDRNSRSTKKQRGHEGKMCHFRGPVCWVADPIIGYYLSPPVARGGEQKLTSNVTSDVL
uniref:(northern house mosquito) hypothetical protein n=1 Tax=Culex pipiens TaxID=7175 RepID=A0A8D8EVM6_CULPI